MGWGLILCLVTIRVDGEQQASSEPQDRVNLGSIGSIISGPVWSCTIPDRVSADEELRLSNPMNRKPRTEVDSYLFNIHIFIKE